MSTHNDKMELEQLDKIDSADNPIASASTGSVDEKTLDTKEVAVPMVDTVAERAPSPVSTETSSEHEIDPKTGKKVKKAVKKPDAVGYLELYRFATPKDKFLIALGSVCAIAVGVGQPLVAILMGNVVKALASPDPNAVQSQMVDNIVQFAIIGCAVFVVSYGQMCCWSLAAENQTKLIREKYLHAVLRQDIGWHDTGKQSESLTTRLNSDTQLIYDGLADKVGLCISNFTTFVAGFVIGFVRGWKLSLVLLAAVPLIGACAAMMSKFTVAQTSKGQDSYSKAGAIAEQSFSSIRTVAAFGGQKRETAKYIGFLEEAYNLGFKRSIATGIGLGTFMFILFSTYALGFWFGTHEVVRGNMEPSEILNVFMGMIIGAFSLGNIGPNVSAFASAQGAAFNIFQTIDRNPIIDSSDPNGAKPENIQGHIVVQNVDFAYPSRPDVPILRNMSIEVKAGQTVALVGHSGSGKSTIVGLIERFYDPLSGSITLDGIEIKDYNLIHLRDTIGIVSQEPVLFNASIKQNIIYGIRRDQAEPTDEEIIAACKLSNAHDFISKLPMKYNTMVGEKGALLSGGQKQRIAIARALIKNPRILLLDEATSALDTESERIVQAALDNAAAGRTTIVIAHRLSTIMNADVIYLMDKGIVVESGTHESLLAQGGVYSEFVAKQQIKSGGVDIESEVYEQKQEIEAEGPSAAPQVAIVDEPKPETRRKSFSTKLRRMSSVRSIPRSEHSTHKIDVVEDEATAEARKAKEAAALLKAQKTPLLRVFKLMRPEWPLFLIGAILSAGAGAVFPMFARFFGELITLLFSRMDQIDPQGFQTQADQKSGLLACIGVAAFITTGGSVLVFEVIGERMARRMRTLSFEAIMSQEMGFFDLEENNTGALASRLATDAYQMHELVSQIAKNAFQTLCTVVLGLGFAFSKSWRLTLVILAIIPLLAASQYFALGTLAGFSQKTKKAYEQSGRVASEAIANIRTVVSLAKEGTFEKRYFQVTEEPHQFALRHAFVGSIGHAMSQAVMFWTYAIGFLASYLFVQHGLMLYQDMFNTMFYVIFMAMGLGQLATQLPKYAKGKQSSINIFELLDKHTSIDAYQDGTIPNKVNGAVGLENVEFNYPTRPDQQIFKSVSVKAQPGQTLALVGPSGCGKSTIIALLERWYDSLNGRVVIDDYEIRDLQLDNIRRSMALVGQEPVLFDISIGDNIRYGIPDGQSVDQEMVVAAARASNIHDFITSLPQGYDTRVGDKGSQLSGGQKQRIAIARALIRNPKILLLDEATSALDSESEKLVQDALDKARAGRTTIVIAHRLRTIQDADLICCVKDGNIVESGKHYELIALKGLYYSLCQKQNLEVTH